jgi:AcrR family transcriptional regulator
VPARKTPPEAWIEAALNALAQGGPDAIRVEALAATLGVTKGGFYGEFADRNALVERMLDTWEQTVVDDVIHRIEDSQDDARTKLRHLFDLARRHADRGLAAELAVRDWARRNSGVGMRLNRVDNRRMAYLRKLFRQIGCDDDDAEARSFLAFSLFVGSSLITAEHNGRTRRDVISYALDRLLTTTDGRPTRGRHRR